MDLNEIKVFVKVAQAGSFSQAARILGMPNSTVSAKVSSLEKRLGVALLQRTTRKLRLTETGENYFHHCLQGLHEIQTAEAALSASQQEAQGVLRVTAPADMGSACLVDLVTRFTREYPKVSLQFLFTDRFVDLVAEGIDVAIRAGELPDSGLISRKLGVASWAPFASPAYLKRAGSPAHPKELRNHDCILFSPMGEESWRLQNGKHTVTVRLQHQLSLNDLNLVKALAVEGNGIALVPTYSTQTERRNGKLIRILPEWIADADPIHLVYPHQKYVAPKVRAFADLAARTLTGIFRD